MCWSRSSRPSPIARSRVTSIGIGAGRKPRFAPSPASPFRVGIRICSAKARWNARQGAMAATPSDSSRPSGTTIPTIFSTQPFRCRPVSASWPPNRSTRMDKEFDVVIVGGGPVGLWLACELALAKVRVVVLERRTERVIQSRALAIHGRTLEVFALRGLADRFLTRGRPVPSMHFGALDTRLDFSVIDTRFPFMLVLPQATTEALLEERALEIGVNVRRGHFVETVEQDANHVVISGRDREVPFRFSARYVVGADGARSKVRHAAPIDFVGHPARHMMMLGDVVLDAPPSSPMVTVANEEGGLLVVSLGDGLHHRIALMSAQAASP